MHLFNLIQFLKRTFYIKLCSKEIRQKEIERCSKINSHLNEKESFYLFNNDKFTYIPSTQILSFYATNLWTRFNRRKNVSKTLMKKLKILRSKVTDKSRKIVNKSL